MGHQPERVHRAAAEGELVLVGGRMAQQLGEEVLATAPRIEIHPHVGEAAVLQGHHPCDAPGARLGQRGRLADHLRYPVIVKSLVEHASFGISRASVVNSDGALAERLRSVHRQLGTDAIIEEYIEGRELYVGIIGNRRPTVLPIWELLFENLPPNMPHIATEKVKHDTDIQVEWGIYQRPADDLSPSQAARIERTCRRIYRALELEGYARIDFRLREDGELFFLEANPNPEIAKREEFASAAAHIGISYPQLLQKIVNLGLRRGR